MKKELGALAFAAVVSATLPPAHGGVAQAAQEEEPALPARGDDAEIENRIKAIIANVTNIPASEITLETALGTMFDSLSRTEICVDVEQAFGTPDIATANFSSDLTVRELFEYVRVNRTR